MKSQRKILDYINADMTMSVNKAVEVFRASAPTIRRNFNNLARLDEVCRYYRGKRPIRHFQSPYAKTGSLWRNAPWPPRHFKCLPSEGVIFVDGGTTTAHIGMLLNSPKLRVITNSLALYEVRMKRFPLADGPGFMLSVRESKSPSCHGISRKRRKNKPNDKDLL